jgi:F-type H+-transporting ATPase subunit delta
VIQVSQVALRYAKALHQVSKNHEAVLNQLRVIEKIMTQEKDTLNFFNSHLIADSHKIDVLKKAFEGKGLAEDCFGFITLLGQNARVGELPDVLRAFENLVDQENGVTRGEVKSATTLDGEERKKIEAVVEKVTHKKVILTYSEDPKLAGGVVAQVGGWTIEDTVESHLTRLKEDLNRRTN